VNLIIQCHRDGFWKSDTHEGGACFNSEFFGGKKKALLLQHLIRNWQVFYVGLSAYMAPLYILG